MKRRHFSTIAPALLWAAGTGSFAQDPPGARHLPRDLRVFVSSPPGGAPDILVRTLGEAWARLDGPNVVVANVDGANGELALARFLREPANGSAWMLGFDSQIVVNPSFYPRASSNILEGLVPVAQVGTNFYSLMVNADDSIKDFDDLVRVARQADPPLHYASNGIGSQPHLLTEDLARRIGVRWNHVPYRGNVHAATGLARGDVRLLMGGAGALPLVRTGKLRIIAVTSAERAPTLPDIPAVAEFVPGFHGIAWFGIFGRAGCDAAQLAEMLEATRRAVGDPRTHVLLRERGNMTALFAGPEALTALIEAERRRFAAIVARLP